MRRTAFAVCFARPAAIIVAILGVCMCSLVLSVYYVHTVHFLTPHDIMRAGRELKQQSQNVLPDDTKYSHQQSAAGDAVIMNAAWAMNGNVSTKSLNLNNLDIAFHIQMKGKHQHDSKSHANQTKEDYSDKQIPGSVQHVTPKKGQLDKMWPIKDKAQKKRHTRFQSNNPLYEKPVRTRQNWNGERYIVYLCHSNLTCAGWGDRQHGILSVYLLSLVLNRTFKVDFSNPCPLTKLFHPRIADWKVEPSQFDGLSSTHLYALNDRSFRELLKEIDFNKLYPQDVVYFTTNYDYYYSLKANLHYRDIFHRKVRNRPRPILFADLWQGIFKMNRRVVRKYTPALNQVGNHKLVCAHIRFGRNPSIPHDSDVRNTLTTIKPFWEFVKKYSDPNKYRLFVASDWEGFRKKVNGFYKQIAIDVEGEVIHIDKTGVIDGKSNAQSGSVSDALCNGLEKVIADQHVLSKCDILLLTYSVFGKAAAYLRRSNKDLYLMDKGQIQTLTLFNEKYKH